MARFTGPSSGGSGGPVGTPSQMIAPFAFGKLDLNNIGSATSFIGMSSAAHQYSAGNYSYVDFTFGSAQPDDEFTIVSNWEITSANLYIEISNKTVNGFRANFWDDLGNELSSGTVGTWQPVFIVYGSNPIVDVLVP